MATGTTNNCDCDADCSNEIPSESILPVIPPSSILTPDEPSLLFLPKVVSQVVSEKQQTSIDTKEAASSQSKDIACDIGVEEANIVTQTTSGGGSTGRQSVPQSLSFSITIPVYHNT